MLSIPTELILLFTEILCHTNSIQDSLFPVALSVFCQSVPSTWFSSIQFSYVPPSFSRACSITL